MGPLGHRLYLQRQYRGSSLHESGRARFMGVRLLGSDPATNVVGQDRKGHRPVVQDYIMETPRCRCLPPSGEILGAVAPSE
jgi:hypothetical protein